jgi:DNA-directed RNA polymerase specialized sigma24 family protein
MTCWRRRHSGIAARTIGCRSSGVSEPSSHAWASCLSVYQAALRLHYWLGASMSEIAVMLDAPENTVKSYLHRARRRLHAMLAERGFDAR